MGKDDERVQVTFKGELHDVTSFIENHPAGPAIIRKRNGKDITQDFLNAGHSEDAHKLIAKYKVSNNTTTTTNKKTDRPEQSFVTKNGIVKVLSRRLFTHEDKNNIHKTLGFLALCSFAYRYLYLLPTTGRLGFETANVLNMPTLFLHLLLSCSSLIFHVLEKRIVKNPLVIYEEYRLHAIVFTGRAIGISVFGMCMHAIPEGIPRRVALVALMLGIHLLVDLITHKYGTRGITAVRNNNDGRFITLRRFFSYYQFCAVATHVIIDDDLCNLGWNAVGAIQSSAFLMTLKRKGLIRWTTHAFWYGLALVLSMIYMCMVKGPVFFVLVAVSFLIRTQFNVSKYIVWPLYIMVAYNVPVPSFVRF